MKKVLVLLLLFIVACSGSSEETAVEDTTTTTIQDTTTTIIPPAPTVDFNIVEIYNTNIGSESELCSDATEIDTTSEKCLRQYRDNLETVFSFDESLYTYITELNTYLESYPSAMTEEYTVLFEFLNNQYRDVPETYGLVLDKYFERFGGVPIVNIIRDLNSIESGCSLTTKIESTENISNLQLTYTNEFKEEVVLNFDEFNTEIDNFINLYNGNFQLTNAIATNYLDEQFSLSLVDSFEITNALPRITKIEVLNSTPDIAREEFVTIRIDYIKSNRYDYFDEIGLVLFTPENKNSSNLSANFFTNSKSSFVQGGEINRKEGYVLLNLIFSDTRIPKNDLWSTTIPLGPYSKTYYVGHVSFYVGGVHIFSHQNWNFEVFKELETACGIKDNIKSTIVFVNNEINVNP